MPELISAPAQWAPFVDLTSSELEAAIGDKRIISVKSYEKDGHHLYSGVLVKDKDKEQCATGRAFLSEQGERPSRRANNDFSWFLTCTFRVINPAHVALIEALGFAAMIASAPGIRKILVAGYGGGHAQRCG